MRRAFPFLFLGILVFLNSPVLYAQEKNESHGFRYRITVMYQDGGKTLKKSVYTNVWVINQVQSITGTLYGSKDGFYGAKHGFLSKNRSISYDGTLLVDESLTVRSDGTTEKSSSAMIGISKYPLELHDFVTGHTYVIYSMGVADFNDWKVKKK